MAFVNLNFIRNHSGTEFFIESVLQVPACLILLYELANCLLFRIVSGRLGFNDSPDLQILHGITGCILGWSLPGDDVSPQGREAKFINIFCG
jgi:hypothetical protein